MKVARIACLLALALMPLTAEAQSVNCDRARKADERVICDSGVLSELDKRLTTIYESILGRLDSVWHENFIRGQATWIRSRNACGSSGVCIENAYRQRIRVLSLVLNDVSDTPRK